MLNEVFLIEKERKFLILFCPAIEILVLRKTAFFLEKKKKAKGVITPLKRCKRISTNLGVPDNKGGLWEEKKGEEI